ncbi:MAG: hypothetical protein ABI480_03835, partial [Chitinophagaceae bacterium]
MKLRLFILLGLFCLNATAQKIDRQAVVRRHNVNVSKIDSLSSLSVGNGQFAFTVDATGLQSFPDYYSKGVGLGTQSEWGWHSFLNTQKYKFEETLKTYDLEGRKIPYTVQIKEPERSKQAVDYFRVNPHRLQLGNIGLEIKKKDGSLAGLSDIQHIDQQLDLWTGMIKSKFTVEDVSVEVTTYAHQQMDAIAVRIVSPLIAQHRLSIRLRFPYPNAQFKDVGNNYSSETKHTTNVEKRSSGYILLHRELDECNYYVQASWKQNAAFAIKQPHYFLISPSGNDNVFEAGFLFSPANDGTEVPSFSET